MINPFDLFPASGAVTGNSGAPDNASAIDRLTTEVRRLERRADQMALVCQALWELLRERTDLTDNDLVNRLREVDLRDGVADGRMTPVPVECPSCHRQSTSKRDECLYCGTRLPGRSLLERL